MADFAHRKANADAADVAAVDPITLINEYIWSPGICVATGITAAATAVLAIGSTDSNTAGAALVIEL